MYVCSHNGTGNVSQGLNLYIEDNLQGLCNVAEAINGLSTRGAIAHFREMRVAVVKKLSEMCSREIQHRNFSNVGDGTS
jgi:hypothetical protein